MEGTVTISLKDYEELKASKDLEEKIIKKSTKAIELLEKIEEFLKVEEIETELLNEISLELDDWYS